MQYFMEVLVDGDLASNNGGWQWSASTGVDPAPYFRIFNPYTQSQKVRTLLIWVEDILMGPVSSVTPAASTFVLLCLSWRRLEVQVRTRHRSFSIVPDATVTTHRGTQATTRLGG